MSTTGTPTKKPVGMDLGTPPDVVQQQKDAMAGLLQGKEPDNHAGPAIETPIACPALPPATIKPTPKIPVTLEFFANDKPDSARILRLKFNVLDVDIGENYISLMMNGDVIIELADIANLNLTYKHETYPVVWAGGNFNFTGLKFSGMSFLRKKDATTPT